ncbi:MAG: type IV secretion system protein [bacterium]|nr:type IV secretion system protein [bacterium]
MHSFAKKYVPILAFFVIAMLVFAPVLSVHAQTAGGSVIGAASRAQSAGKGSPVYCVNSVIPPDISIPGCLVLGLAYGLSYALDIFSYLITLASALFDIALSIQNEAFYDQPIVNAGWMISRDVVNIVYIFVLLIIAIATILGIESYGMKSLLFKLIISALLVNFSLAIAGIIVDTSNALGNQFYSAMGNPNADLDNDGVADGRDIATTFVSGFKPQNIIAPNEATVNKPFSTYERLSNAIIAYIMGIILILIATFVIGAGAILLVIRIVYIWILFILAPFAFLFYVLPTTSGMAQKWFKNLFEQSFFYPAYMFFLYLVFKIIAGGGIESLVNKASLSTDLTIALQGEAASQLTAKAGLVLGFIFLGILLMASLIAAKSMGAYGASGALKIAGNIGGKVRGALYRPVRRTAQRAAGTAARGGLAVLPQSRVGKALINGLGIGGGLRTLAAKGRDADKERAKAEAKKAKGRDPRTQARMMATMNASAQKEVFDQMKDGKERASVAKELKNVMGPEGVGRLSQNLKKQGVSDGDLRAFAAAGGGVHEAMKLEHPEYGKVDKAPTGNADYDRRLGELMHAMSKEDRHEIYRNEGVSSTHVQDYFMKNEKGFNEFRTSRKDIDQTSKMLGAIKSRFGIKSSDGTSLEKKIREEYGNADLANQFAANPGIRTAHANTLKNTSEKVGDLGTKRSQLETQKQIIEVRRNRAPDRAERERLQGDMDRIDDRIQSVDRQIAAQGERQTKTQEEIKKLDNPRLYTGNILLETPGELDTTISKGKSDIEKEVERLKREMGDKADKET